MNKQQAQYQHAHFVKVGHSAQLGSVNHPKELKGDYVVTSPVVSYDETTGEIITANTIYTKSSQDPRPRSS